MRIGLISGEYPPMRGGVGDFTRELGRALAAAGHEMHVITGQSPAGSGDDAPLVVHREIAAWGWRCWKQVLRIAQRERLDVLDLQFQTAAYRMHPAIHMVPRRLDRPPVAVTFHDLRTPYLFPKAGPLRWRAIRVLAQRADGVIVTNEEDRLRLMPYASRVALIPIGSNIVPRLPADYNRAAWRVRWGLKPSDLVVGYFGFLKERKGGEDLVEAVALLAARGLPVYVMFIGGQTSSADPTDALYVERVERLISERGLTARVRYTGFVSSEEVSEGLAAVDVCLLPYRDGVSLRHGSLHACLAHGRAIVTTRPAIESAEFRDGENVLLAPPGDVGALADAVARVASDPELRARLEAGAAALAAEFTWERIAARTAEFLESLARGIRTE